MSDKEFWRRLLQFVRNVQISGTIIDGYDIAVQSEDGHSWQVSEAGELLPQIEKRQAK